mgnify:CR=1 FL=1
MISGVIISSVVPNVTPAFIRMSENNLGIDPVIDEAVEAHRRAPSRHHRHDDPDQDGGQNQREQPWEHEPIRRAHRDVFAQVESRDTPQEGGVGECLCHHEQQHPEQNRDLIVRVAGYSDYFCDISRELQDEIISRTEQAKE